MQAAGLGPKVEEPGASGLDDTIAPEVKAEIAKFLNLAQYKEGLNTSMTAGSGTPKARKPPPQKGSSLQLRLSDLSTYGRELHAQIAAQYQERKQLQQDTAVKQSQFARAAARPLQRGGSEDGASQEISGGPSPPIMDLSPVPSSGSETDFSASSLGLNSPGQSAPTSRSGSKLAHILQKTLVKQVKNRMNPLARSNQKRGLGRSQRASLKLVAQNSSAGEQRRMLLEQQ
jgi:hypothetical protein